MQRGRSATDRLHLVDTCGVRFVLCETDELIRSMVEEIVVRHGHEVVGIADSSIAAAGLVEHARPDAVVIDLSLGYTTDFDVVTIAAQVGARVIVFSYEADQSVLKRHPIKPIFVLKPDLTALERAVEQVTAEVEPDKAPQERRRAPVRSASGPVPTGPSDAQAFYETLNEAIEGDALLAITAADGPDALATDVAAILRGTDRLLVSTTAMQVLLLGGGDAGARSFVDRLAQARGRDGLGIRSVVLEPGEVPAEAFARLKRRDERQA